MTDFKDVRRSAFRWLGDHRGLLFLAFLAGGAARAMDSVSEGRIEAEADRLETIAADLTPLVDADELAGALATRARDGQASRAIALPKRAATVEALRKFAERNGLDRPIRILSIKDDHNDQVASALESTHRQVLEVLLATSDVDGEQRDVSYAPIMVGAFFDHKTVCGWERGAFASTDFLAYTPVLDSFDSTVAVLEISTRSYAALVPDVLGAIALATFLLLLGVIAKRSLAPPLHALREELAERRQAVVRERRSGPRADGLNKRLEDAGCCFERSVEADNAEHVDIVWAVEAATRAVKKLARERGVKIHCTVPDALRACVLAHPELLYTVLEPLLDNAVRHTRGGGTATVRVLSDANNSDLRFEVADTGMGIPWEEQYRLLQPALDESGTEVNRTGGLDVARAVLQKLGGQIGFESQPGLGTRIWFTIPSAEILTLRASA